MTIHFPDISPIAFKVFNWPVYWYGLAYLGGFALTRLLLHIDAARTARGGTKHVSSEQYTDLVFFYGPIGIVIGGRLGSVLFYHLDYYLSDPIAVFKLWEGGMSFHGGFIGCVAAVFVFCRRYDLPFFQITDRLAVACAPALGLGRLANFVNGELWGRPTDGSWGMIFPHVDMLPRHPSQLYEFLLEGVLLFLILWLYTMKARPRMAASGLFVIGYGGLRFLVEFTREPDRHIGYLGDTWLTMGQLLSMPMMAAGAVMMILAYRYDDRGKSHASIS